MALNEKQLELKLCPIGFELLEQEHPISASRGGKNVVFHYCDALEQRASYAGCLATLEAIAEGRGELRPDCEVAKLAGNCPAVRMRMDELRAGRSLYFVEYTELMERRRAQYAEDRENSPVQFRRKKFGTKFVPTRIAAEDVEAPVADITPAPISKPRIEIQTNIMEQVLQKKVNDE